MNTTLRKLAPVPLLLIVILLGLSTKTESRIATIEHQYPADFSDDQVLVGASHNIFIGKIIAQVGTKERGIGPETQFTVEVIDNIKGNLVGTVIVNQEGGTKDGITYIASELPSESATYFLKPGSTYVLATRFNNKENWHTLNSYPTAKKLLSEERYSSVSQLKALIQTSGRVAELRTAYNAEILLDADVKNGNTLNSYQKPANPGPTPASAAAEEYLKLQRK